MKPLYKTLTDQKVYILLILGLILTSLLYWPALSGPFLLDDNLHLPKLKGQDGQIDSWLEVMELTFSGSGASGRPLSFLSLLISDNAWPTNPFWFKYTNLCFHLINGLLLFLLVFRLSNAFKKSSYSLHLALIVSFVWMVHPINLSAVLFSIQRMTILMAACNILGLLIYAKGRFDYSYGPWKRYFLMSVGIIVGICIGVLFKETAVMMVVYLLALEYLAVSLEKPPSLPFFSFWKFLLWLPLLFVCLYFVYSLEQMQQLYLKRDFNLSERVMTEWRVLVDYMRLIFLPKISEMGPYHDDYVVSRGLFDPISTFFSLILLICLSIGAFIVRKRYPLILFTVFCFIGGHILESTILPLELYYEHRNYLPSIALIVVFLFSVLALKGRLKMFTRLFVLLWLLGLIFVTWSSANVWGDREKLSNIWIAERPLSLRARLDSVRFWLDNKDLQRAFLLLEEGVDLKPNDAGLILYGYLVQNCNGASDYNKFPIELLRDAIPNANFDHASLEGIRWLIKHYNKRCNTSLDSIEEIAKLYLSNDRFFGVSSSRAVLYHSLADIYRLKEQLSPAIESLENAYAAVPRYEYVLQAAYYLAMADNFDQANDFLKQAKETKTDNFLTEQVKDERIKEIEKIIEMKKADSQSKTPAEDY